MARSKNDSLETRTGRAIRSIDDKRRILIPSDFLLSMEIEKKSEVCIYYPGGDYLDILPISIYKQGLRKIGELPPHDEERLAFAKEHYKSKIDGIGRLRLPYVEGTKLGEIRKGSKLEIIANIDRITINLNPKEK